MKETAIDVQMAGDKLDRILSHRLYYMYLPIKIK